MICLSVTVSNADIDYQKKYKEQVEVNIIIDNEYQEYKNTAVKNLNRCNLEKTKLEEQSKSNYIIRIPFTKIGITNQHGQGFICGVIFTVLVL